MPRLILTSVIITALMLAIPITSATASTTYDYPCAKPQEPAIGGAVFNNPIAGDGSAVIEQICGLVQRAPAGSTIKIAHFVISGESGMDFTRALLAADARGVAVRVVLDGWQVQNPASVALIEGLGRDKIKNSWVHVCSHLSPEGNTASCIGDKGQHNKFYLFSQTAGEEGVVVQSSANFTDLNWQSYWNNAVTISGNRELYRAYDAYFDDLAREIQNPDYYRTASTPGITAHFFPSADTDPVLEWLREARCNPTAGRTKIKIGMSEWSVDWIAIAERLAGLAGGGCDVRVVTSLVDDAVVEALVRGGVRVRRMDPPAEGRIHSKYLIAEGMVGRQAGRPLVITGSPNFNHTSLRRNDEAMLEISNRRIYQQYEKNFEVLWLAAGTDHQPG